MKAPLSYLPPLHDNRLFLLHDSMYPWEHAVATSTEVQEKGADAWFGSESETTPAAYGGINAVTSYPYFVKPHKRRRARSVSKHAIRQAGPASKVGYQTRTLWTGKVLFRMLHRLWNASTDPQGSSFGKAASLFSRGNYLRIIFPSVKKKTEEPFIKIHIGKYRASWFKLLYGILHHHQ